MPQAAPMELKYPYDYKQVVPTELSHTHSGSADFFEIRDECRNWLDH